MRRRVGVVIFMSPVLATRQRRTDGALGDVEHAGILLAAFLIDIAVDGDLRIRLELKVVASLKVMPSADFAPVCTTSLR